MILTQNVLPIIVSLIDGKLVAELAGNEHVARAQQFYSAKNATFKSNQPNLLIRVD